MAGILNTIFGFLKSYLNSMTSPVSGFGLEDVKVNTKGDIFSSLFSFQADSDSGIFNTEGDVIKDMGGNKIEMNVLLRVDNARSALAPIFSGLANIGKEGKDEDTQQLFALLLGSNRTGSDGKVDNSYEGARARGKNGDVQAGGLLGVDLTKAQRLPPEGLKYANQFWSWEKIAKDYLIYGIECQAAGADYGSIENVKYDQCSKRIGEYLELTNIVTNADEVKVDEYTLVAPILISIQGVLGKYLDEAYKNLGEFGVKDSKKDFEDEKAMKEADRKSQEVDIYEYDDNGELKFTGKSVSKSADDFSTQLTDYAAHGYVGEGGVNLMDLAASKHINIALKKITGTTEIELTAIKANYNPTDVLDDVEEIISQQEFIDALTEEPQMFAIDVDDDGYDIEQCECCEIDPCDSLWSVMQTAIVMYRNLYMIHWMSKGNDMMKLHLLCEDLYEELIKEIDTLGELIVEKCGTVKGLDFEWSPVAVRPYGFQESLPILKDFIQNYIDTIDFAYCNQASDVQSTMDEWLRFWNKQMNYFIKQQED